MADVLAMKEIEDKAASLGIDLSTIDLDSIHLPHGEDCGILSDDEEVFQEENLEFDTGFGNIIVVDNTPVVTKEKFAKLEGVIRKIFNQMGVIKDDGFWMPVDPVTEKTVGYCFIEYNTPQEAELAKEKAQGYKLDHSHIFTVSMFDDFDRFMRVPDEWAPPPRKEYAPGENLQQWLTDAKARDQFVIRASSDTEVLWNDARHLKPDPIYKRAVSGHHIPMVCYGFGDDGRGAMAMMGALMQQACLSNLHLSQGLIWDGLGCKEWMLELKIRVLHCQVRYSELCVRCSECLQTALLCFT
ncbi:eukaryotic translation initiation factor 3 subunit B-like [Vicia villosa]|uniref:eukaryotic translation initiation factor 3 subunit B-like n=1 Tax=Vicia villosa TaxID=3911 RepID=UPI00273B07D5|nr:eukaryotic translation initiation factor 3 subunit B-like [Vicia villosa]